MAPELDNVDRGVLHLLQKDARNTTARDIADRIGVSASTVRNRIEQLEADGVIDGYHPMIHYESTELPLQLLFVVTAEPTKRTELVEDLLDVRGVVEVRETLTGRRNIYVEVVATDTSDVTRLTDAIHDLGLEIESSDILNQRRAQPFDHFHYEGEFDPDPADE